MNAILATNFNDLNKHIISNFNSINVIVQDIQTQNEAIEQILTSNSIDFILLTDLLRGEKGIAEFLETITNIKDKNTKVYYVAQNYDEEALKTLARLNIKYHKRLTQTLDEFINSIFEDFQQQEGKLIIKEKVILKKETIEKEVQVGFKKLVLTVWDNPEFGCELAYIIAKNTKHNVMLIDLDLLAPKADMILNIPKYPEGIRSEGIYTKSGLNIILDAIEKDISVNELIYKASIRKKDNRNLHILTGNYDIKNYEYYNVDSLKKLVDISYSIFDITILLVNKSIYDEFTFTALQRADYNLTAIKANLPTIREYNMYLMFLKEHKHIPLEKTKFIAYEYIKNLELELNIFKEIVENNLIGVIGYCEKRQSYRNKKLAYVRRMDSHIKDDYIKLLSSFNIVIHKTYRDKLKEKMVEIRRKLKRFFRSIKVIKNRKLKEGEQ